MSPVKMVDLKLPKKKRKELSEPTPISEQPEYPYGLSLRFEKDQIAKLPVLAAVEDGQTIEMTAKCFVKSVESSRRDGDDSKKRQEVQLEVREVAFTTEAEDDKEFSKAASDKS